MDSNDQSGKNLIGEGLAGATGGHPVPPPPRVRKGQAARRSHYHRRHTVHYFLVVPGVTAALISSALNGAAFATRSIVLSEITFAAVCITALIIFTAFFWGFYMIMSGHIPYHRLKILAPHAIVGVLSPLFYTLNISIDLDGLGISPISGWALALSVVCLVLLAVQFTMGKLVVRSEPLHIVPPAMAG
ncbi:MAG: hypothetical protein ACRDFX_01185 [Chloroflexota bacterium]